MGLRGEGTKELIKSMLEGKKCCRNKEKKQSRLGGDQSAPQGAPY